MCWCIMYRIKITFAYTHFNFYPWSHITYYSNTYYITLLRSWLKYSKNKWYDEHNVSKYVSEAVSTLDWSHLLGQWVFGRYMSLGLIWHMQRCWHLFSSLIINHLRSLNWLYCSLSWDITVQYIHAILFRHTIERTSKCHWFPGNNVYW